MGDQPGACFKMGSSICHPHPWAQCGGSENEIEIMRCLEKSSSITPHHPGTSPGRSSFAKLCLHELNREYRSFSHTHKELESFSRHVDLKQEKKLTSHKYILRANLLLNDHHSMFFVWCKYKRFKTKTLLTACQSFEAHLMLDIHSWIAFCLIGLWRKQNKSTINIKNRSLLLNVVFFKWYVARINERKCKYNDGKQFFENNWFAYSFSLSH